MKNLGIIKVITVHPEREMNYMQYNNNNIIRQPSGPTLRLLGPQLKKERTQRDIKKTVHTLKSRLPPVHIVYIDQTVSTESVNEKM